MMMKIVCFVLVTACLLLSALLLGCASAPINQPPTDTGTLAYSVTSPAREGTDKAYSAAVGEVTILSGGVSISPVAEFLTSATWDGSGMALGDGKAYLLGVDQHELDSLPILQHHGQIDATITGGNCTVTYVTVTGQDDQETRVSWQPVQGGAKLELPGQSGIFLVTLTIRWDAEKQRPQANQKEYIYFEYLFKAEYIS